jgi:hypothetical protein
MTKFLSKNLCHFTKFQYPGRKLIRKTGQISDLKDKEYYWELGSFEDLEKHMTMNVR